MKVSEFLRQSALASRDSLAELGQRASRAEALRNAAEERVKRATTEITRQRTLEIERKKALGGVTDRLAEAQRSLDEIERKRQVALDAFIKIQDEQRNISSSLRDAQTATESAMSDVRKEQEARQAADFELSKIGAEREGFQRALRRALLSGLDSYLEQQSAVLRGAFSTQEQRSRSMKEYEAFKKARHTDTEIGRLCDERDELRKLFDSAMVPGVKDVLQSSLKAIETRLAERFPIALHVREVERKDNQIEELLFFCDRDGKAVFFLPLTIEDWKAADREEIRSAVGMSLVWGLIRELGLRTEDGDFRVLNDRPILASQLELEVVAASQGLAIKCEGAEVIRYVLVAVPTELQDALSYEDQNS